MATRTWLRREQTVAEQAALAGLDRWLGYPSGGHTGLDLPGWDRGSTWRFDPQADCYFAQLWRNSPGRAADQPDIWITGWDTVEGPAVPGIHDAHTGEGDRSRNGLRPGRCMRRSRCQPPG